MAVPVTNVPSATGIAANGTARLSSGSTTEDIAMANSPRSLPQSPAQSPALAGPSSPREGNRFGLSLGGLIARRPRALTRDKGPASPQGPCTPGTEDERAQSPIDDRGQNSGGEGRPSYFPSLRRKASRRTDHSGDHSTPGTGGSWHGRGNRARSQSRHVNAASAAPAELNSQSSGDEAQQHGAAGEHAAATPHDGTAPTAAVNEVAPQDSDHQYIIRLVPHLDASRSLHFDPIERRTHAGVILRVGRFTDRNPNAPPGGLPSDTRIAFKSKVVSRGHADIYPTDSGSWFIKDTKSSSGTFLNHIRLSAPGSESRPFPLRDGDVLQLGVDYQGGHEDIYRCVKMRVELNREWQRGPSSYNQAALAQLRALGAGETPANTERAKPGAQSDAKPVIASSAAVTDCCICLFAVTVCQALFIAPCSHVYHYKCIRPLLQMHHPGFACPLCRTFADLEADVETDQPMYAVDQAAEPSAEPQTDPPPVAEGSTSGLSSALQAVLETQQPDSRPASIMMTGPVGVGVSFAISPAPSRSSRPGSVRSMTASANRGEPRTSSVHGSEVMEAAGTMTGVSALGGRVHQGSLEFEDAGMDDTEDDGAETEGAAGTTPTTAGAFDRVRSTVGQSVASGSGSQSVAANGQVDGVRRDSDESMGSSSGSSSAAQAQKGPAPAGRNDPTKQTPSLAEEGEEHRAVGQA